MEETTVENTKGEYGQFNPPRLHREEVDFSYISTNVLLKILSLSQSDTTNSIDKCNAVSSAIDSYAMFLQPLRDELWFADMDAACKIESQYDKNLFMIGAITNLLARRKLLFQQKI